MNTCRLLLTLLHMTALLLLGLLPVRVAQADTWTETKKTMLVIRVDFPDLPGEAISQAELTTRINLTVSNQLYEMSYGKTWVEATVSPMVVRLPSNTNSYAPDNWSTLHNDALAAFNALNTGVNVSSYNVVAVAFKSIGMSTAGRVDFTPAYRRMWLNQTLTGGSGGGLSPLVITHEMGHVYSLAHADAWVGPLAGGSSRPSGDPFDLMANIFAFPYGHFNLQYKSYLNWLTPSQWTEVSGSGTYRIYRFDHVATASSNSRGLRIVKSASPAEYFWVGYRRAFMTNANVFLGNGRPANNAFLSNGAYLLWQRDGLPHASVMLDATPETSAINYEGQMDAPLLIGRTYSETTANVHITPLANGGSGANEWLDVRVNRGPFPGNRAPVATLTGPASVNTRTPVAYTASASDPDGDALAYAWDFGDGMISPNAPSITHSWHSGGTYSVRVVVSDMKGLMATQSLVVTVQEPLSVWTARNSFTTSPLYGICVGANASGTPLALAVGAAGGTVCFSTNGSNWTASQLPSRIYAQLHGVTYDGARFLACGRDLAFDSLYSGTIWASTDGSTWTQRFTGMPDTTLYAIASSGPTTVAVGENGTLLYSTSGGTNWSPATSTASSTMDFRSVAWGGGRFVAVAGNGASDGPNQRKFTSANGVDWSEQVSTNALITIRYLRDRFVTGGYSDCIRYSIDGGASLQSSEPSSARLWIRALAYGNGAYFAAGGGSSIVDTNLVSGDGALWTGFPTVAQSDREAAVFFRDTFITVGRDGAIWQSAPIPALPSQPVVTTLPVTTLTANEARINGSANPSSSATKAFFQWGTTISYGQTTPVVDLGSGSSVMSFSNLLSGLTPSQTYHYRAVASNAVGIAFGNDMTFTVPVLPVVTTLAATALASNAATLNASANPKGSDAIGYFQWGTTMNYGQTTAATLLGSGNLADSFSKALSSLIPGQSYHYRAVVSNAVGISSGANMTFTTPTPPGAIAFANIPIAGLSGVFDGAMAWGDYDSDGRLDFLLTGNNSLQHVTQLWRNTGSGFVNVPIAGLPGVSQGSVAWSDYDRDGRLDFFIAGNAGETNLSQLRRNTGSGFANVPMPGLPQLHYTSVAWGDYDNDGRPDLLLAGNTGSPFAGSTNLTQLWRNTGSGFTQVPIPGVPAVDSGAVAWGDYNNDSRLDFLITGYTGTNFLSQLWRNTGSGFANVPIPGLPGVYDSSVAWGDYNNDGRLDFLIAGQSANLAIAQVWQNTGAGFASVPIPGILGASAGSVAWGDADNDGRLDFLLTGNGGLSSSQWRNTGNGFTNVPITGLPGNLFGTATWADYDNDGRLDCFLTGAATGLWRNTTSASNTPPSAPTDLLAQVHPNSVTLSWLPATDSVTPVAGLSYNVVLATASNSVDIASPMASLSNGFRRVVQWGGANQRTSWTFTNLPPAPIYYWSVQALDTTFAGGPFAPVESLLNVVFTSTTTPAPGQATLTFNGTTGLIYTVERSDDLVVWVTAGTAVESPAGSGRFTFTDNTATASLRYYRLRY